MPNNAEVLRKLRRERTDLRIHLRDLTHAVSRAISALDAEMALPPGPERGKRVARICNALQLAKDRASRFSLGRIVKPGTLSREE